MVIVHYATLHTYLASRGVVERRTMTRSNMTNFAVNISSELLLDEKGAQVGKLPSTRNTDDEELDDDPANDAAVGGLGLVSELGFSLLDDDVKLR